MGFMDKLKNVFFEEEESEEVIPDTSNDTVKVKKVEIPRRKKEVVEIDAEDNKKINEERIEKTTPDVEEKKEVTNNKMVDLIFDEEDFVLETTPKTIKREQKLYNNSNNATSNKSRENRGSSKKDENYYSSEKNKYEYTYKETEQKRTFKPSPIISPIYGILDKNYTKEEIVTKKEIRITSRSGNADFDSIRNKAFGELEKDLFISEPEIEETTQEKKVPKKRENRKIYDMMSGDKPKVERVTIGEADEYYNDLGLAYNTDYNDLSKDLSDGKDGNIDDDRHLEDNLFDLIESMYDKED